MDTSAKTRLVEILRNNSNGICEPDIPQSIYISSMQSYGLAGGERLYYAHCNDGLFVSNSKVFLITNLGIHYASYFARWENISSFAMVGDKIGVTLQSGRKQAINPSIHGVSPNTLSEVIGALNQCVSGKNRVMPTNQNNTVDTIDGEESSLFIKCQHCGEVYTVGNSNYGDHDVCWNCEKCGNEIGVRFFGFCKYCNKNIGFTDDPNDSTLKSLAKGALMGILKPDKVFDVIGRYADNIPNAKAYGICMNCGRQHIECPECGTAIHVPKDADLLSDVFTCPKCGTKMRHP